MRRLTRDERGTTIAVIGSGVNARGETVVVSIVAMQHDALLGPSDHRLIVTYESDVDQRYDVGFVHAVNAADAFRETPTPMILHCTVCGVQHIDKPEPDKGWTNPPHRTHLCHACGNLWRPQPWATVGVESL